RKSILFIHKMTAAAATAAATLGRLELVAELPGHQDRVWQVCWHSTGRLLASCSGDQTVRLWAIKHSSNPAATPALSTVSSSPAEPTSPWSCAEVLSDGHKRTIRSVAFSKQAGMVATGSFDATTGIWEAAGGRSSQNRMDIDDDDNSHSVD